MNDYGMSLFPQHAAVLVASGITPDHARRRGYVTVDTRQRLEDINVTKAGRRVPGLLVPSRRVDGTVWGYQYRPDDPRLRNGGVVKYETPSGQRNGIDVPPGVGPMLGDPNIPLLVTEGVKKADSAATAGLACIALPGVWSWRGRNGKGGKTAISDWHDIALNDRRVILAFDSDVVRKRAVRRALDELAGYLASKGARVEFLHLPDDDTSKTGLDDFLAAGHSVEDLLALVRPEPPPVADPPSASKPAVPPAPPVPAPPEDAVAMVDAVAATLTRYVAFPSEHARDAVALWIVHTHVAGSFDSTPRLALLSPEPQSGKTRTLEVAELLVHAPMFTSNTTVAVLARSVDAYHNTVLLDECDAVFGSKAKEHEDLRAILNAGHRRGATYDRMVGEGAGMTAKRHEVFTPVALAGIGDLPETVMQRSIVIPMRRRAPGEHVESFRLRVARAEAQDLQASLIGWAAAHADQLAEAWPQMPNGITDRPADVWEPLLAVADAVGGDWPERARAACVAIVAAAGSTDTGSLGIRLLADIRSVLAAADLDRMPTDDLLHALHQLAESPWSDLRGKPLDARGLANRLRGYGVHSHQFRLDGEKVRGYSIPGSDEHAGGLHDAFTRYLPPVETSHPEKSGTPGTPGTPQVSDPLPVPDSSAVPVRLPVHGTADPALTSDVPDVPDVPPPGEEKNAQTTRSRPIDPLGLGHLPGRCQSCGWHVEAQGHDDGCEEAS